MNIPKNYPDKLYVDSIEVQIKKTRSYSLSEPKIAKLLSIHCKNMDIVASIMKRLIKSKMFYRTVHKNDYQYYARWSFKFIKKGVNYGVSSEKC